MIEPRTSSPLVSCILPFYNAENDLCSTLTSISEIDYPNLELILVNDGSNDSSLNIALKFIEDSRLSKNFEIINNQKNLGVSFSKNIGLDSSSGDYFFFAASDDYQHKKRISIPLQYLVNYSSLDIVYFDCNICTKDGKLKKVRSFPPKMNEENSILFQLKRNHFWSGLFLARNTIRTKFDQSLTNAVDYDWYFNLFFSNKKIGFIRECLLDYKTHENNISKDLTSSSENVRTILSKYDFQKLREKLLDHFDSNDVLLSYAWVEITKGNYLEAIDLLKQIDRETNFFEITFLLGSCFFRRIKYEQAIEYFSEAHRQYPESIECINNLAVSLFLGNKCTADECLKSIKSALEINPRYSDAKFNCNLLEKGSGTNFKITEKPLRETLIH